MFQKISKIQFIFLSFLFLAWGCKKENPAIVFDTKEEGYIIVNEGQFGKNNGSVSFLEAEGNYIFNDLFLAQNGVSLGGDILQSIQFNDGKAYLVINNSNKIVVVDSTTFEYIDEIIGIFSPREKVFSGAKSFITRLFTNNLDVYENGSFSESLDVGGDAERMFIYNNKLFVPVKIPYGASSDVKGVKVFNLSDLSDDNFIQTVNGAESIAADGAGNLWILCNGGFSYDTDNPKVDGKIYKVNPSTLEKIDSLSFGDVNFSPAELKKAVGSNDLYFREGSKIYKLNTSSSPISYDLILTSSAVYTNGFLVDAVKNQVIITDAVDYSSQGDIFLYNLTTKALKKTLKSEVGPSKIYTRY